jgi:hypothetical protein
MEALTLDRIQALTRFLSLFDQPGREFVERWALGRHVGIRLDYCYPQAAQRIRAVHQRDLL